MIVPKGIYEIDEESNVEKYAEEFTVPSTDELKSTETWGHRHPNILKSGRCSHYVSMSVPEEEREEQLATLAEKDPV